MPRSPLNLLSGALSRLRRSECSSVQLALCVAIFIALADNVRLIGLLMERLVLTSFSGPVYLVTACLALVTILTTTFLLLGTKYLLKPVLITFLLLSAGLGYFSQAWGIVFDVEMIRNAVETYRDNNSAEAKELLSLPLALHLIFFGLLPAIGVALIRVRYQPLGREVLRRLRAVGLLLAVVVVTFLGNFKFFIFFSRENRDLRCWAIPTYALHSLERFFTDARGDEGGEFKVLGLDAVQEKPTAVRTVGVLVVGETARADHFSLNGYGRDTNPLLSRRRLLNYPNVSASGTSTAYAVPCMFSLLGRKRYSPKKAKQQSNVLDVLERAGIDVVWIDNNSSSKGVCDRIGSIRLGPGSEAAASRGDNAELFDEVLVREMEHHLDNIDGDALIVLHMMGSHGPAYHRRYPPAFERFRPSCKVDTPQSCSDEELTNAYDNTILYTDFVLDALIESLERRSDTEAAFLFFVSDHGESLGENGIYLHGMPYFLAPKAQIHVPMLVWMSDLYQESFAVDYAALERATNAELSHDNLSHSLLGLFDVRTEVLQEELDIFHQGAPGPAER